MTAADRENNSNEREDIRSLRASNMQGTEVRRAGLRQRVEDSLVRCQIDARKQAALCELQALLEKNPDIARILELREEIGV